MEFFACDCVVCRVRISKPGDGLAFAVRERDGSVSREVVDLGGRQPHCGVKMICRSCVGFVGKQAGPEGVRFDSPGMIALADRAAAAGRTDMECAFLAISAAEDTNLMPSLITEYISEFMEDVKDFLELKGSGDDGSHVDLEAAGPAAAPGVDTGQPR